MGFDGFHLSLINQIFIDKRMVNDTTFTGLNEMQDEDGVKSVAPPSQPTPVMRLYHMGWRPIAHDHRNGDIEAIFEFCSQS